MYETSVPSIFIFQIKKEKLCILHGHFKREEGQYGYFRRCVLSMLGKVKRNHFGTDSGMILIPPYCYSIADIQKCN